MSVLFWIAVVLFAVVGAFCVTPLRLGVLVRKEHGWASQLWLQPFGRYGPQIPLGDRTRSAKSRQDQGAPRSSQFGLNARKVQAVLAFLRAVITRIRIDQFRATCRFGCSDPAETGELFGLLAPFVYGAFGSGRIDVSLEPDFTQEVLQGEFEAVLSLVPAHLFRPFTQLAWRLYGSVE